MRIDRLLAITVLMLGRERVTAAQLAERFEVSLRTIYRDIDAMTLAGIPVIPFPGNGGGYGLMENYRLDKRLLQSQDIRAILSSLSGVNRTLGDRGMQNALDKIASLLPRSDRAHEPGLFEQLVIDLFPWDQNSILVDRIRTIHQGISETRLLHLIYQGMNSTAKTRKVEPMTLVFKGYGWYLFAYCLDRQDFRFFKISRIRDLHLEDQTFQRRPVSYESHLPHRDQSASIRQIVLDFDAGLRSQIEDNFASERKEILSDGRIRLTLNAPREEWVLGMILSYGPRVSVVSPDDLRTDLIDAAKKIIHRYQS